MSRVFTARYALSPYTKQTHLEFKGLRFGALSRDTKRKGYEADKSPPSHAEFEKKRKL